MKLGLTMATGIDFDAKLAREQEEILARARKRRQKRGSRKLTQEQVMIITSILRDAGTPKETEE